VCVRHRALLAMRLPSFVHDFICVTSYATDGYVLTSPTCRVLTGLLGLVVECATAPGVGAHHNWTVSVNGLSGLPSAPITSYAPPVVQEVGLVRLWGHGAGVGVWGMGNKGLGQA
jgi:hypothetical protein